MQRVLTSAVLIPFILWTVLLAPAWVFSVVVALVAAVCYREFTDIARAAGFDEVPILGYAAGLALLFAPFQYAIPIATPAILLALAFSLRSENLSTAIPQVGMLAAGILYIFGAWKTAIPLHALNPWWLVFGLALNWIGDTGAFYVGRRFGTHKMAPRVSPAKSWEGAAASVFVSVLLGAVFLPKLIAGVGILQAAGLSVIVNIAGQIGDLAESALKRGAGVKDSGTLLPGHGGLLDRVDSSMFALPVLYGVLLIARTV